MEKLLQFDHLAKIREITTESAQLGDSYIVSRLTPQSAGIEIISSPVRFSALTLCLVTKGEIVADVNLQTVRAGENAILTLGPSSIVQPHPAPAHGLEAHILIISSSFLEDLNIDTNAINLRAMMSRPSPVAQLTEQEAETLTHYFKLLQLNAATNPDPMLAKNIGRSLVQAIVYQLIQYHANHRGEEISKDSAQSRRISYVHDFISLVRLHHSQQRTIAFYASKLFISPKYLSHIIKESTGKSAAEWIDQFVIQEAKSLLRFSNKNVQQVAYTLNFPTQSAFGKYFKHLTGMSPTQYQKT